MGWIATIVVVLIIILVIMTWFTAPKVSIDYFKAVAKSGKIMATKIIHFFKLVSEGIKQENKTRQEMDKNNRDVKNSTFENGQRV